MLLPVVWDELEEIAYAVTITKDTGCRTATVAAHNEAVRDFRDAASHVLVDDYETYSQDLDRLVSQLTDDLEDGADI